MAFTLQNWCRASASALEPIVTLTGGTVVGCFREYNYYTADAEATVSASGYFNAVAYDLVTGDYISSYSTTSLSRVTYRVTNTAGVITVTLVSGEVTSVTAITAAAFNGMYVTPITLLAAPGANRILVLESCVLAPSNLSTTDYANGGVVHVQYTATTNGGGLVTSGTIAATEFTSDAETTTSILRGLTVSGNSAVAATLIPNAPLCLSNQTASFTTGAVTYNAYTKATLVAAAAAA